MFKLCETISANLGVKIVSDQTERNSQSVLIVIQVARVFYYLSAAALQYLAPTILLLFSVLTLRTLGRFTVHTAKFQHLLQRLVFLGTCRAIFLRHRLVRENFSSLRPRSNVELHTRRTKLSDCSS